MAIEAADEAGGLDGKRIRVVARDTHSDPRKAIVPTQELLALDPAVLIGPDYGDVLAHLEMMLAKQTVILPSFATFDYIQYKPHSWFVMGPGPRRVRLRAGRPGPRPTATSEVVQLVSPNNLQQPSLSWDAVQRLTASCKHGPVGQPGVDHRDACGPIADVAGKVRRLSCWRPAPRRRRLADLRPGRDRRARRTRALVPVARPCTPPPSYESIPQGRP